MKSEPKMTREPNVIRIKSTLPEHTQNDFSSQKNSFQDPLEMGSIVSANKKPKVPESMKTFLKERKQTKNLQRPTFLPPSTLIEPLKNLNSSTDHLNPTLNPKNQLLNDFQNQNLPDPYFSQSNKNPQQKSRPQSKQFQPQSKISRPQSSQKYFQPIICPICQTEIDDQNIVKAFTCRHIFCQDCIKSYIKLKINIFQQVPCPQDSCKSLLNTDSDFYKKLSKRERRIYKKINNFHTAQNDPSKKLCPKENCDGVITLQQGAENQVCPECKGKFCSNCYLDAHWGQCQDYEIRFMEDTLHYRQCIKCRIVVQKVDGCNHITCKCGYQFCYICGGVWQHDHICNPLDLVEEESGCDWGESWQDHFLFLLKLPLKFVLTTIYSLFWFGVSFAAAPYNLFFFIYWLLIIFLGGVGEFIFEDERSWWEVVLLMVCFPVLMVYCLPRGIRMFLSKFQEECPFISDGYQCILRI